MKKVGTIWYVGFSDLVDKCGIPDNTIKQGISRGLSNWQSIKDPEDHRKRLIRYDTLKPANQVLVRAVLLGGQEPDQWHQVQQGRAEAQNSYTLTERVEQALTQGYRRYEGLYVSDNTSRAARKTTLCLARAAAVIELLIAYTAEQQTDPRSYGPYDEVIAWFNNDGNYDYYFPKGSQYLPLHRVRLKEKVQMRRAGTELAEVIHLPRKGNQNRDEFASDGELMAWIMMGLAHGRKDPKAYVMRKVQEVCRVVGRDVPSASWFAQVMATPRVNQLVAHARHGADSPHFQRYTHSITMARAMYAGDCWMMDATRVNFIEHRTAADAQEKRFLVVIVVRDAYSGYPVGVHFDTKEDRWGYACALKMAVKSTGYLPHTLVHDRFPGHLTDEMQQLLGAMERKGVALVCTHRATGKALLERWFDTLQTVFLSQSRYYYGQGIRSTREYAHRSPDYLTKLRKEAHRDGWDFDQAWAEAWRCLVAYAQTPVSHYSKQHKGLDLTPQQLHAQSEKPNVIAVETYEPAGLFWLTKVLDIRRNAISHEVHGKTYTYAIYDREILYRYQRVAVKYDEADPSSIMLFAVDHADQPTDFFITDLRQTTDVVMYGPNADPAQLAKRQALGKRVQDGRQADLDTILNQAHQDPEYLLTMGGRVAKSEYEGAETAILYEQMATVQPAPATQVRSRKAPTPPGHSTPSGTPPGHSTPSDTQRRARIDDYDL